MNSITNYRNQVGFYITGEPGTQAPTVVLLNSTQVLRYVILLLNLGRREFGRKRKLKYVRNDKNIVPPCVDDTTLSNNEHLPHQQYELDSRYHQFDGKKKHLRLHRRQQRRRDRQ